jgi:hypothetical protein
MGSPSSTAVRGRNQNIGEKKPRANNPERTTQCLRPSVASIARVAGPRNPANLVAG